MEGSANEHLVEWIPEAYSPEGLPASFEPVCSSFPTAGTKDTLSRHTFISHSSRSLGSSVPPTLSGAGLSSLSVGDADNEVEPASLTWRVVVSRSCIGFEFFTLEMTAVSVQPRHTPSHLQIIHLRKFLDFPTGELHQRVSIYNFEVMCNRDDALTC
ncbi:hypothetical protein BDY19DRAFT_153568 [Irpex rosettiformis]|uniref:Uncharacterized protein n=1 Tax=Irpex rosettiformis TaxID=378272 RepID=A0ACB8U3R3_9APHY|nr:hypothetical protein BDY19DRAFT_153568 [Irpex rosettiformis]